MSKRAPYGFEYIRLAVPDLREASAFYEYHVGLTTVDDEPGRVTMRADLAHHCVELIEDASLERHQVLALGFSVESRAVLAELEHRVSESGHPVLPVDDHVKPFVTEGFATLDPDGFRIELVFEFQVFAEPPLLELRPLGVVHPFLSTPKFEDSLAFYTDVLGYRPSDYIAFQTAFLRGENRYHHSLALKRGDEPEIAHVAFLMKSFDHVMRGFGRARYKGIPTPSGVVNHSASRSLAFYMQVPRFGPPVELCDGHLVLTPEQHETHVPRRLSADPRNIDLWRAAADDWGLT